MRSFRQQVAEGGRSRDDTEAIVGMTVEMPLQRRLARVELDAATVNLARLGIDAEAAATSHPGR